MRLNLDFDLNDEAIIRLKAYAKSLTEERTLPYFQCRYFDRCENNICPLDPRRSEKIWFADEGLCANKEFRNDKAVVTQRKLARRNPDGYFTYEMLNREMFIRKGIKGIDPDVRGSVSAKDQNSIEQAYRERELLWLNGHPEITEEQKQKRKDRGRKGTEALRRYRESTRRL